MKRIRLTESDLHRIVKESVKRVLKEDDNNIVHTDTNETYKMYCPECGAPISYNNSYFDEEYNEVVFMCPQCGADCSFDQLEFVPN